MNDTKTKKQTEPSSLGRMPTRIINLPTSWKDMTDDVWIYVCRLLAVGVEPESVANNLLLRAIGQRTAKHIPEEQLGWAAETLDFIGESYPSPCRPNFIQGIEAVDVAFHGVPYSSYLMAENCYQGCIIQRHNLSAADALLNVLYPGYLEAFPDEDDDECRYAARFIVIKWWESLKKFFAEQFPDLFKPIPEGGEVPDMREVMTSQIRTLDGGDITKEDDVLAADTWSALTELNAKVKDSERLKNI